MSQKMTNMNMTYVRYPVPSMLLLALAAGCANAADSGEHTEGKEVIPSDEVFEFAPEGEEVVAEKKLQDDALVAKGSVSRPYGQTFNEAITIGIGQTVTYSTSGGSVNADPVLVLFRRHDNSPAFSEFPYTQQVGIRTLAINDDTVGLHSSISYTNTSGAVENAFVMAFAYGSSTGQVMLSDGFGSSRLVTIGAGSVVTSTASGLAWTSQSGGDPWLFAFDLSPGSNNGGWQDDSGSSPVNRESLLLGLPSVQMWFVMHGFNSGTTTLNVHDAPTPPNTCAPAASFCP